MRWAGPATYYLLKLTLLSLSEVSTYFGGVHEIREIGGDTYAGCIGSRVRGSCEV